MPTTRVIRWKILPWQMIRWLNQTTGRLAGHAGGQRALSQTFVKIYLIRGFIGIVVLNLGLLLGAYTITDNMDRFAELALTSWMPWFALTLPALSIAVATPVAAVLLLVVHTGDRLELAGQLKHPVYRAIAFLVLLSLVGAYVSLGPLIPFDITFFPLQLLIFLATSYMLVVTFAIVIPMTFFAPFTSFGAADGHLMMPALVVAISSWLSVAFGNVLDQPAEFDLSRSEPVTWFLVNFTGPVSVSLIAVVECLYLSKRFGVRFTGVGTTERY